MELILGSVQAAYEKRLDHITIEKKFFDQLCDTTDKDDLLPQRCDIDKRLNSVDPEEIFAFVVVYSSIAFSTWKKDYRQDEKIAGQSRGANKLMDVLIAAKENDYPITDAAWIAGMSRIDFDDIFADTEWKMMDERHENLKLVGKSVVEKFDGLFINILKCSGGSAINIVKLLNENMNGVFCDSCRFKGIDLHFLKLAQLVVMITGYGLPHVRKEFQLSDLELINALADYKIPQYLRHVGVLKYDEKLSAIVDGYNQIPFGNIFEIEIRIATVCAVHFITNKLKKKYPFVTELMVDMMLWNAAGDLGPGARPHHLVRSKKY